MSTDLAALVARLEKAVASLEAFRATGGPVGAQAASALASAGVEEKATAASLTAYDEFFAKSVAPFIATCRVVDGTKVIGDQAETAFKRLRDLVEATTVCKKPSQGDLLKFLDPIVQVVTKAQAQAAVPASPVLSQLKAWGETVNVMNWVFAPGPVAHIKDTVEAADFWNNKTLLAAKSLVGDEQKAHRDFVSQGKALVLALADYVKAHHTTGPAWNVKGYELSAFKPGSSSAAVPSGVPPPPPVAAGVPPPPPVAAGVPPPPPVSAAPLDMSAPAPAPKAAGMAAVFSELNKGEAITSGLRKVTSDMKSKNMKDVPVLTPQAPKAAAAVAVAAAPASAPAKKPATELKQGTWFVENYENTQVELTEVQMKQSVYVVNCKNTQIKITTKAKAVAMDKCQKVGLEIHSVVSTAEVVNSTRSMIHIVDSCPSVAIDKSSGITLSLSRTAMEDKNRPTLVSSNISEVNVLLPGKTDSDDPIEVPVPEQYQTSIDPATKKLITGPVSHSG